MGEYSFQNGLRCPAPVMTFTPFYLGNDLHPENYTRGQNYGAQISVTVPLDQSMTSLCKQLASKLVQRERLRYELERLKNCAEVRKLGFTFDAASPFATLSADVVPVAAAAQTR